jgi:hypothetical protein
MTAAEPGLPSGEQHEVRLHRAYARRLRGYPAAWRTRNGEAMIAALMDQADAEGRSRPTAHETVALAWAGVSARVARGRPTAALLPAALLPAVGIAFAVLWIMAETGRWYSGSSPFHTAAVAALLGAAIAVARLSPASAIGIVTVVLAAQLVWGAVRLGGTAWPMDLAVLVAVAGAASSRSPRVRRVGLMLAVAGGLAVGALLILPVPSIGPAVPAPFGYTLAGTTPGEGAVIVAATMLAALGAALAAWGAGRLLSRLLPDRDHAHAPAS